MPFNSNLTTAELQEILSDEVSAAGGVVSDTFNDGSRLFTRSILPGVREVRPRDNVQGGVALKATEQEVWVHPYVFRQVCSNGAIIAYATQTQHIEGIDSVAPDEASSAVREAIRACSVEEAFSATTQAMRSAREMEADLGLNLLPLLSRLPSGVQAQLLNDIMSRFLRETDQSRFSLMNAVTSVARDTRDPELRWRLEEFGGAIPIGDEPPVLPNDAAAQLLEVG